jgi:succinyl-CoA synthetase beta subunit
MSSNIERRKELVAASPVPVIPMEFLPSERTPFAREFRRSSGSPYVLDSFARGIPALAKAMWWAEKRREAVPPPSVQSPVAEPDGGIGGRWSERQVVDLLATRGVPVVPQHVVRTAQEAEAKAEEMTAPLVMKVSSADITHKTDVGGVALGLESPAQVREAFERMMDTVRSHAPDADIEGVVLSPMRPDGVDLLVGFVRDSVWGLTLVVGLGGVWVEVLKDTAIRVLPVGREEVLAMLAELKGYPMLTGARGGAAVDLERLADVICRLADVAVALGEHLEGMEVNPLRAWGDHIEVLDALVLWNNP